MVSHRGLSSHFSHIVYIYQLFIKVLKAIQIHFMLKELKHKIKLLETDNREKSARTDGLILNTTWS